MRNRSMINIVIWLENQIFIQADEYLPTQIQD